jgi:hypothetical protein
MQSGLISRTGARLTYNEKNSLTRAMGVPRQTFCLSGTNQSDEKNLRHVTRDFDMRSRPIQGRHA